MNIPKFIITRFTHGTAGKFLSTVLQTSNQIDHWSSVVQKEKESGKFLDAVTLQYVKRSFPANHSLHLQSEPMVPYCTDLYSTGYPRGNDVTLKHYLNHAKKIKDIRLQNCMKKDLMANLVFHKPQVAKFCQGAKVVTILTSTTAEKNWLHSTLWSKHFLKINGKIHHLPMDPDYCNFVSLPTVLRFQNEYQYDVDQENKLFDEYVVNSNTNLWYDDPKNFVEFDVSNNFDNRFINLKDFFELDTFIKSMLDIFDYFDLGILNKSLVADMYGIWWDRQIKL